MFSYSPLNAHFFSKVTSPTSLSTDCKTEFLRFTDVSEFFFISHPSSGQKEGSEQERIMYFYPPEQDVCKQTEITGMSEAIVNFTQGVDMRNPYVFHADADSNFRYVTSTNSKEVVLIVEDGEFLIGTSFNRFFTPYLQLFRVNKIPLVDLLNGVDFLSIDSVNFLEVDCLMTNCMQEFPFIKKAMFFYQERLVQYTIEKTDLASICHFLNHILIPSAVQAEVSPHTAANGNKRGSITSPHNGFIVDGSLIADFPGELSEHFFPKVFLRDSEISQILLPFELIAYRVRSATVCFFIDVELLSTEPLSLFIDNLINYIDDRITSITSRMESEVVKQQTQSDILYHYLYFNPDSLSLRKSFPTHVIPRQDTTNDVQLPPSSLYRHVYEAYDRFVANASVFGQIFLKADNDWWIVFKRIEKRILILFISQTIASTIVDIEFYVDNIIKSGRFKILFIP